MNFHMASGSHNLPMYVLLELLRKDRGQSSLLAEETGKQGKVTTYAAQILQEGMYIVIYFHVI